MDNYDEEYEEAKRIAKEVEERMAEIGTLEFATEEEEEKYWQDWIDEELDVENEIIDDSKSDDGQ